MLRLTLISPSFPPIRGGIADYAEHLSTALEKNFHLSILTSCNAQFGSRKTTTTFLPVIATWRWGSLPVLLSSIRDTEPDVVLFNHDGGEASVDTWFWLMLPLLTQLACGKPALAITHELRRLSTIQSFFATHSFFVDHSQLEFVRLVVQTASLLPTPSSIPGVQIHEAVRDSLRRMVGAPDNSVLVAYFGKIDERKGFDILVEAMKVVRLRRDAQLLVIGLGSENYNGAKHEWMRFTGYLQPEEVARLLSAADVCALPYAHGSSLRYTSLLAALSQEVQVVTTVGVTTDLPGITFVPIGDVAALADAILSVTDMQFRGARTLPDWDETVGRIVEVAEANASWSHVSLFSRMPAVPLMLWRFLHLKPYPRSNGNAAQTTSGDHGRQ